MDNIPASMAAGAEFETAKFQNVCADVARMSTELTWLSNPGYEAGNSSGGFVPAPDYSRNLSQSECIEMQHVLLVMILVIGDLIQTNYFSKNHMHHKKQFIEN